MAHRIRSQPARPPAPARTSASSPAAATKATPALRPEALLPQAKPSKIAAVAPLSAAHVAHAPLKLEKLLPGLAYGCGGVLDKLADSVGSNPTGALALALTPDEAQVEVASLLQPKSRDASLDRCTAVTALVCALVERCSDAKGQVDLHKLEAALGPEGKPLVDTLRWLPNRPTPERANDAFLGKVLDNLGALLPQPRALALADKLVRNDALIPIEVPALEHMKSLVPDGALKGQGLVGLQHPFPTLVPLLEACVAKGMAPQDLHIHGSGYFHGALVTAYCRLKGFDVESYQDDTNLQQRQASFHALELMSFLGKVARVGPPPPNGWVLLDDGGLLHSALCGYNADLMRINEAATARVAAQQKDIAKAFPSGSVRGVEQTTRGLTELAKHAPPYEVVTVANAPGKVRESEMIGWSLAHSFLSELRHEANGKVVKKVVIISAGKVGRATAEHLQKEGFRVSLVDTDPQKVAQAKEAGFDATVDLGEARRDAQAIIACTGKHSLDRWALEGFSGFIGSGSSQVVDFDPAAIFNHHTSNVRILNIGRPLNFKPDGHEDLDKQHIGLTRALLFQAICQQPKGGKGPVPLELGPQQSVIGFWEKNGGATMTEPARPKPCELPRPDLASPDGAPRWEWETFLNNSDRPVARGIHENYFEDGEGKVRYVSRSGGKSVATGLPAVPELMLSSSASQQQVLIGGPPERRWLRIADVSGDAPQLGPVIDLGRLEGWCISRGAGNMGLAGVRGDALRVLLPAAPDKPLDLPLPPAKRRVIAWGSELDPPVVFGSEPASVTVVDPATGKTPPEWQGYSLPKDFVEVTGVDRVLYSRELVLIGKDAQGNTLVTPLDRTGQSPVIHLPPGAKYRGVHLEGTEDYDHKSEVIVDYVPAGAPDELDNHKHEKLPLPLYAQDEVRGPKKRGGG